VNVIAKNRLAVWPSGQVLERDERGEFYDRVVGELMMQAREHGIVDPPPVGLLAGSRANAEPPSGAANFSSPASNFSRQLREQKRYIVPRQAIE